MTRSSAGLPALALRVLLVGACSLPAFASDLVAARLEPPTVQDWDRYMAWADAKVTRELADPKRFLIQNFLSAEDAAHVRDQLAAGQVVVRKMTGVVPAGTRFEVHGGEIHHWWGAILVQGVKLDELLRFLKDYDNHAGRFTEVQQSRLLARDGERYRFSFRLKRT